MQVKKLFGVGCLVALASFSVLVACSSSDTSSTPPSSSAGESVTVRITAAQGGTVADKSGKVSLAIPAGALAEDTDISLKVGAQANGSAGDVYDFGPDGLKFLKPATLTLKGDGITVPADKTAAIGLLEGTTFTKVEGSTFANGVATAPVMHFTKYAIILIGNDVVLQPPSSCTDAAAKFTNCGGDPTGTWKFSDYCIDPKVLGQLKPTDCTDWVASIEVDTTQTVTFSGGATSGTVTTSDGTVTSKIITDFSKSCYGDAGASVVCADLSKPTNTPPTTCTDSATAGKCHCEQIETKQATGNTKAFPDPDPTNKSEYCVQGSTMTVREFKAGAPTGTIFILAKQ